MPEQRGRTALLFVAPWAVGSSLLAQEVRTHDPALPVEVIDVEEHPGRADRYLVVSIPTLVVFEGGKEKGRLLGAMSIDSVRGAVRASSDAKPGLTKARR